MNPVALIALLLYLAFLAFYALWSIFLSYHLLKFSPHRQSAFLSIGLFLGVTFVLLLVSVAAFLRLDWSAPAGLPVATF